MNTDIETTWGVAVYAHRVNNGYVKYEEYDEDGNTTVKPNKVMMYNALENPSLITDDDIRKGKQILSYFQGQIMFKAIKDELNDFEHSVQRVVEMKKWTLKNYFERAILASLPKAYERALSKDAIDERIRLCKSEHIGNVKQRQEFDIEILKSIYSRKWETYYITGVNSDDNIVWFGYREGFDAGNVISIRGTVKAHWDNGQTQLNRVFVK